MRRFSFFGITRDEISYDLKKIYTGDRIVSERKTDTVWKCVKKDPLLIKAVCLYLEEERILDQSQQELFKKAWFARAFQENHEKKKKEGEV